jgi:hypothetical protein
VIKRKNQRHDKKGATSTQKKTQNSPSRADDEILLNIAEACPRRQKKKKKKKKNPPKTTPNHQKGRSVAPQHRTTTVGDLRTSFFGGLQPSFFPLSRRLVEVSSEQDGPAAD